MHLVDQIKAKARQKPQTVVLPEGYDDRMIQAAGQIVRDGLAKVVLLGNPDTLKGKAKELLCSLDGVELLDPKHSPKLEAYVDQLCEIRKSKGLSRDDARKLLTQEDNLFYGAMMVKVGDAGGAVAGAFNAALVGFGTLTLSTAPVIVTRVIDTFSVLRAILSISSM